MSQSLTVELSDAEYAALQRAAETTGAAPDEWAAARLREQLPLPVVTPPARSATANLIPPFCVSVEHLDHVVTSCTLI